MINHTNQLTPQDLEAIVYNHPSQKKIGIVDTAGNITYSLIVGTAMDYGAGLNFAAKGAYHAILSVFPSAMSLPSRQTPLLGPSAGSSDAAWLLR